MKNVFPPLPIEVTKLEDAMVQLINDGICSQEDLCTLARFSPKISNADIERRKNIISDIFEPYETYTPYKTTVPLNRTK